MNYKVSVESLAAKEYLVIPEFVVLGDESTSDETDSINVSMRILAEKTADGSIERLKHAAGSGVIFTLFCRSCEQKPGKNEWVCGYDIACENFNGSVYSDEFEIVRLEPSEYAIFDCDFDNEITKKQAYEKINTFYWGDWLPKNPYISMIEVETGANEPGIASIELATPLDPNTRRFNIKMWFPVKRKT